MTDLELLDLEGRTLFVLAPDGRIIRENDPDCSGGPRFWLAGCAAGNAARPHRDVPQDCAAEIEALVARQPPFHKPDTLPPFVDRYQVLLPGAQMASRL